MVGAEGLIGAVVTNHKVPLLAAVRDRFVYPCPLAELFSEVNSVGVRPDGLHGVAKDAVANRKTLDETLGPGYFIRAT
jgi:shikimate 5-dehydrogenase